MTRMWPLPDGRTVDLTYFVNWRPYLWLQPTTNALRFLGNLQGKTVLEIGGGDARMSCLFALLGVKFTMIEAGAWRVAEPCFTASRISPPDRLTRKRAGETHD